MVRGSSAEADESKALTAAGNTGMNDATHMEQPPGAFANGHGHPGSVSEDGLECIAIDLPAGDASSREPDHADEHGVLQVCNFCSTVALTSMTDPLLIHRSALSLAPPCRRQLDTPRWQPPRQSTSTRSMQPVRSCMYHAPSPIRMMEP